MVSVAVVLEKPMRALSISTDGMSNSFFISDKAHSVNWLSSSGDLLALELSAAVGQRLGGIFVDKSLTVHLCDSELNAIHEISGKSFSYILFIKYLVYLQYFPSIFAGLCAPGHFFDGVSCKLVPAGKLNDLPLVISLSIHLIFQGFIIQFMG